MDVTLNILVVEDNADDVFLLRQAFKKAGVFSSLHTAADGVEALAYLGGKGPFVDRLLHPFPDVVLLDLNLPRKDGFEVLEWIRSDPRCCRLMVHILTASSRSADVDRAYELHANSYTVKPNRISELVAFSQALHQWHGFVIRARAPAEPTRAVRVP